MTSDRKNILEQVAIATLTALFTGIVGIILDKFKKKKDDEEKKEEKITK